MSEDNKPSEDEKKNIPIAEVLIATGIQLAQEKNMSLGELVGHYEVAKIEVYNRITAGAKAAAQTEAPAEGGDTEKTEDALTVEDGGKA
jgi:hypothetical protein